MEKQSPEPTEFNGPEKKLQGVDFLKKKEEILNSEKYLKMEDCKDGYLYIIIGRHAYVGIYGQETQAFITNRKKFNDEFIWEEDHWDTGVPFGTAIPLKEIGKAPEFETEEEKMEYLKKMAEELRSEIERLVGSGD